MRRTSFFALASVSLAALAAAAPAAAQATDPVTTDEVNQCAALPTPEERAACIAAQTQPEGSAERPAEDSTIVVTGSRIMRPDLDSPVPVTTVTADELLNDGAISLGDALNDLPSLRSTFSTSNSQRFIGTTGLNILDLRGLGTTRTLVLVNGRRHITSSAGDFRVDVNTIPYELLQRVDIVTGGSSAVYGSDAIAGVVNFILKRDFEGLEFNGQAGISERGDNGRYSISGAFGRNFADGRGNIALVGEYTKIDRVFNSQRPEISGFGIGFTEFVTVDTDNPAVNPTNADDIPDLQLRSNILIDFISEGGTVATFCRGNPAVQTFSCPGGIASRFRFSPDGRLFQEFNPEQFPGGRAVGGTGSSFAEGTLIPDVERYNINLLAHFDVSDAFRPYAELKYARIDSLGQNTPTFFNSFCGGLIGLSGVNPSCATGLNSAPFFIRFDNPFLNPQDANTIREIQRELLAAFGAGSLAPRSQGFFINRNNTDFGTRNDDVTRETYRGVVGFEGDISSNTRYDVSFTYGQFTSNLTAQNQLIFQNTRNAVDAVRGPGGSIVCRINADTNPANDDPACVPLNVLGAGNPNQAALDYILTDSTLFERAKQYDVLAFVNTDSSPFFELPGGPIRVVLGGEFRREEAFAEPDELSASGATFFNAFSVFDPPALEVLEGFGEIEFPILRDLPFAEELTVSAAGRISDYNSGGGNTGTVEAYNFNASYAPVRDLRFRANYSRAVRAPTLSDLFSPQTENFLFLTDPCDERFINQGTSFREGNCRAAGVPVGFRDPVTGNRSVFQGGNELLEAETSDSYTVGVVVAPSFLPGFTVTADYYDIEVNKVIANINGNQILANCFDRPTLANQFCDLVAPREPDGALPLTGALNIAPVNFAKLTAEGVDVDARYGHTFGNADRLNLRLIASYVIDRTNFLDVDNPDLPNRIKSELGDPELAFNFNASYRRRGISLSYGLRWIGKQTIGAYENYFPFTGQCPASGMVPRSTTGATCTAGAIVTLPPANPDLTAEVFYPERAYHDLRVDFPVNDDYNFYFGVDNLTDKLPPFGLTGAGSGSGIFDNTGRFFFAGVKAGF